MKRSDWDDRFVDLLLREKLGGREPPDLLPGVRSRVRKRRRVRRLRLCLAAAAVMLAVLAWCLRPERPPPARGPDAVAAPALSYRRPRAEGDLLVRNGGRLRRGARVMAGPGGGILYLGGYARVEVAPRSLLALAGRPHAEVVVLDAGKITCDVQPGKGRAFTVRTEMGTVSVLGTRFTVQVKEDEMRVKEMAVKVLAGMVLVTSAGGETSVVQAGENNTRRVKFMGGDQGQLQGLAESMRRMFLGAKGDDATKEKKETPAQKRLRSLKAQRLALRELKLKIERKVLLAPAVIALMNKSRSLEAKYRKQLEASPQYKVLKDEKARLEQERVAGFAEMRNMDRDARRAKWAKMREVNEKIRQTNEQLEDFPKTVPALVKLRQACEQAAVAYIDKVDEMLNADPAYIKLYEQMQALNRVLQKEELRKMHAHRKRAFGPGVRRGRQKRRKKQGGEPGRNPKPTEPVATF